jgi:predicted  nucleic acid-binding Zn-ribbon protein
MIKKLIVEKGNPSDYQQRINDEMDKIKKLQDKISAKKKDKITDTPQKIKADQIIKNLQDDIKAHQVRINDLKDGIKALSKHDKVGK